VYNGYIEKYDICSVEDPFDQDDWEAWSAFNKSAKIQNVGDDLLVTNPLRIKTAIEKKACNALLLKVGPNTRANRLLTIWIVDQPDWDHQRIDSSLGFRSGSMLHADRSQRPTLAVQWVGSHDLAPLRRDRVGLYRRPRRRPAHWVSTFMFGIGHLTSRQSDQDRRSLPFRAHG